MKKELISLLSAGVLASAVITNDSYAEQRGLSKETDNGDEIEIDLTKGIIKNHTKEKEYRFIPIPEFVIKIIEAGGLLDYIDNLEVRAAFRAIERWYS